MTGNWVIISALYHFQGLFQGPASSPSWPNRCRQSIFHIRKLAGFVPGAECVQCDCELEHGTNPATSCNAVLAESICHNYKETGRVCPRSRVVTSCGAELARKIVLSAALACLEKNSTSSDVLGNGHWRRLVLEAMNKSQTLQSSSFDFSVTEVYINVNHHCNDR